MAGAPLIARFTCIRQHRSLGESRFIFMLMGFAGVRPM